MFGMDQAVQGINSLVSNGDFLTRAGLDMAGSVVNSALSYQSAKKLMKKQAQYNWQYYKKQVALQDQMQRAFQKDQTKWGLLYTPALQMEGLRSAGINPILGYNSAANSIASGGSFGGTNMTGGSTGIDPGLNFGSALDYKTARDNYDLSKQQTESSVENTKASTDLLATKVSSEETKQDLDSAQAEKLREEAASIKLSNDLKAATNARDIHRAKTDYEVESIRREQAEKHDLYHGFAPPHDTPYGRKREMELSGKAYLDNPTRQKLLDLMGAIFGSAKAVGSLMPKGK